MEPSDPCRAPLRRRRDSAPDLDADIVAVVRGVSAPLLEVLPLSGANPTRPQPAAFRLRFGDGRVLKCRLFPRAEAAARVEHLLRIVAHPALPRVLARCERAMLLEWIEGRTLDDIALTPELSERCGRLQASLHGVVAGDVSAPAPDDRIRYRCRRLEDRLGQLVDAGILTDAEAGAAGTIAQASAPADCAIGLSHHDFCAENLVLGAAGELSVIDNESLQVGDIEYALARTWYRWPMGEPQWRAYLDGYGPDCGVAGFGACFPFWAIAVLVDSAVYRLGTAPALASVPADRLRTLLTSIESGDRAT